MSLPKLILAATLVLASQAHAQTPLATSGTLVIVPAFGEVKHANDQATAMFTIEEQDKDKSAAASRVNQKMKQGTDIIRQRRPAGHPENPGLLHLSGLRRAASAAERQPCRSRCRPAGASASTSK